MRGTARSPKRRRGAGPYWWICTRPGRSWPTTRRTSPRTDSTQARRATPGWPSCSGRRSKRTAGCKRLAVSERAPMIEARGLRKTYRSGRIVIEALRGVDLVVPRGEMLAIMGSSGCGKTTLLHCLSGLDDFDGGEVKLAGVALRSMSDDHKTEFRARHTGFVFQAYNLLPVPNARENVELPLLLVGVSGKEAQ